MEEEVEITHRQPTGGHSKSTCLESGPTGLQLAFDLSGIYVVRALLNQGISRKCGARLVRP